MLGKPREKQRKLPINNSGTECTQMQITGSVHDPEKTGSGLRNGEAGLIKQGSP